MQKRRYAPGNHHANHLEKMSYFQVITTLLTTGTDDPCALALIKMLGHQYQWLAGGYDLQTGYF